MNLTIFDNILILLTIAVVVTSLFRRWHIPTIVGYVLIGTMVGPHVLGWLADTKATRDVAEFGIVFLLFTIGLEFSLVHLISMKKIVFGYGSLQVILSIIFTVIIGKLLGMTTSEVIIVGSVVAMSSTAIVTKQLIEQIELNTPHGINAVGILLFQDLAVIPLLILVPSLIHVNGFSITFNLFWALIKGIIAISLIIGLGRYIMRPLFYQIAKRQSVELFTLTVLLITIGSAWVTHKLGLSLALGAFLAGMMLGETEFRHQIEADIRPFRDVLLALFFISIGMQLNPQIIFAAWQWELLLLAGLIFFKIILVTGISITFGDNKVTALRSGLLLAQGGEFGFAILMLAISYQILPHDYTQVVLGALLLSMMISPFFIRFNKEIVNLLLPGTLKKFKFEVTKPLSHATKHISNHVIICGFGRVGQNIASFLDKTGIKFIALDMDAKRVAEAYAAGKNVFYADASQYGILKATKLDRAKAIVISFSQSKLTLQILQHIRRINKHVPIIVRGRYDADTEMLYEYGATQVIPETFETSLMLASHVLLFMHIPINKVRQLIEKTRRDHYDILHYVFPSYTGMDIKEQDQFEYGLHTVTLTEDTYAIGKKINELVFTNKKIIITAIRRGRTRQIVPLPDTILQTGDVLVLYGPLNQFENAENTLLTGSS